MLRSRWWFSAAFAALGYACSSEGGEHVAAGSITREEAEKMLGGSLTPAGTGGGTSEE